MTLSDLIPILQTVDPDSAIGEHVILEEEYDYGSGLTFSLGSPDVLVRDIIPAALSVSDHKAVKVVYINRGVVEKVVTRINPTKVIKDTKWIQPSSSPDTPGVEPLP